MTKRWLSLVVVLTLLASCFTGAMAETVTPKATVPVITFQAASAINATSGQIFTKQVLGKFYADGQTINSDQYSTIYTNVMTSAAGGSKVWYTGATAPLAASALTLDPDGTLKASFTGPTAVNGQGKISFYFDAAFGTMQTPYDFQQIGCGSTKTFLDVVVNIVVSKVTLDKTTLTFNGKTDGT